MQYEPVIKWKEDRTFETISRDDVISAREISPCGTYARIDIQHTAPVYISPQCGYYDNLSSGGVWVRCCDLERDNLRRLVIFRQTDKDHPDMITPKEMMDHVRKYSRKVLPTHTRKGKLTAINNH